MLKSLAIVMLLIPTLVFSPDVKKPSEVNFLTSGIVSYYADQFHGKITANGEKFNMYAMTAAHRTLPFNTLLWVVDKVTGNSVYVRINDRGPYWKNRVLDISMAAAERLGIKENGVFNANIYIVDTKSLKECSLY